MPLSLFLDELFVQYPFLVTAICLTAVAVTAILVERLVSRWIKRFTARADLPPRAGNALLLAGRLVIFLVALIIVLRIGGVSPDVLVALSALSGAAIGFASSQTIGNMIAGLYILASRPFRAGDYVRVDGIEGIVSEISVNYTKILAMGGNVVWISNRRLLDRDIVTFLHRGEKPSSYRYGIEVGFDYSVSMKETQEILDRIAERYTGTTLGRPEHELVRLTNFSRNFMFYVCVRDPREIFRLQPSILKDVTHLWDEAKKKAK